MRKVILFMHMSLDGFVAGPNGEMDWISVNDEIFEAVIALQPSIDTALFGGKLYQEMAGYWPTVPGNPNSSPQDRAHAEWLNSAPKLVFSTTLPAAEWGPARLIRENLAEEVAAAKAQPGKDLILFGGASIAQVFMKLNLIDEYRLNINPVILGSGKALFAALPAHLRLKLVESRPFSNGVLSVVYQRAEG
jgi:dihydrofolate reductase